MNLYLASAKRFADTSIESVELITERAAPETGLEAQLMNVCRSLDASLQGHQPSLAIMHTSCSFFKDYLILRQRFLMQSSLNEFSELITAIEQDSSLSPSRKEALFKLLDAYYELADKLLAVDLAIS